MADQRYTHPRDLLVSYMARIYGYRMTTTSGGNLSVREPGGEIWITPAKIDKGRLQRSDIVLVRADGSWESAAPPSSELPLHQTIYRTRPDVGAIVHAHPVALVAFSIVGQVPSTRVFHQAWRICGEGTFAPYRLPGSAELGESIAAALGTSHSCAILENHGVVAVGSDLAQAFQRFETFEFAGKSIIKARLLGGEIRELSDAELASAGEHVADAADFTRSAAPSTAEQEVRTTLQDFVRRGYHQRLFISTHGTFSARVDDASFVITPHDRDRGALGRSDLVLVDAGRKTAGSRPSHATRLHEAIYRRHRRIGAIINAAPVNVTAFAITGSVPDTRTIPESRLVVRSPTLARFQLQFQDPDALAETVSPAQPIAMLENDGVLVTGATVLEAFDRLEVLESTAEALINARALGPLSPMDDRTIAELEAVFFPDAPG
ncbi:MAG: class II aldolase/adducin family protein [Solirubrobacteraceae bacterium]